MSRSREAELDVCPAATLHGFSLASSPRSERKRREEVYSLTEEVLRGHPYFRSIHQFLRTAAQQQAASWDRHRQLTGEWVGGGRAWSGKGVVSAWPDEDSMAVVGKRERERERIRDK